MATIKEDNNFPDIKIQEVDNFPDLCVYVTKFKSEAQGKDEIWFYDQTFGDTKIKKETNFPDLKIKMVQSKMDAGWKKSGHPLKGKLK